MKLQHNNPHESYGEEDQNRPCHFYWAKKKKGILETNHGPVLCRDFLGDTLVWKAKEVAPGRIYSWVYHGEVETKYTSLVLDDFGCIEFNVKSILNPIEEKIGVKLTTVEKTEDGEHVWVKGDKFWMLTTVHFSWYTTLLRYLTWDKKFTAFTDLEEYPTNEWMDEKSFALFTRIPYILHDLKVTQVSGTKNVSSVGNHTMHDFNGWRAAVDNYKSKFTEYGEQLRALLA